jgi:acyl carrier protein
LARGYAHQPALTAERFLPNPWSQEPGARLYRTGDLVRYRADGSIEYLGRVDQQIKLRGYRIEPGEIETMLGTHPAIQNAVVLTQERGDMQRLVAYLILQPGQVLGSHDLRSYLQDRLPSYMIPSAFVYLDALPLTPNGKLDRHALPMPEESQHADLSDGEEARTPIEELLVGLWRETLEYRQIGISDNFFLLGGHSLLATQLMARIRAVLGVEIPLRALFEAPTVAEFAQQVEQVWRRGGACPMPALIAGERPAALPLSFAQQRLWFLEQLEPGSTAYLLPSALRIGES